MCVCVIVSVGALARSVQSRGYVMGHALHAQNCRTRDRRRVAGRRVVRPVHSCRREPNTLPGRRVAMKKRSSKRIGGAGCRPVTFSESDRFEAL